LGRAGKDLLPGSRTCGHALLAQVFWNAFVDYVALRSSLFASVDGSSRFTASEYLRAQQNNYGYNPKNDGYYYQIFE
jgi:hypothetical protein